MDKSQPSHGFNTVTSYFGHWVGTSNSRKRTFSKDPKSESETSQLRGGFQHSCGTCQCELQGSLDYNQIISLRWVN